MRTIRWGLTLVGGWVMFGAVSGAMAQGLNADAMRMYGGRYAVNCAQADSPRVVVQPRQMHIEQGNRRLTVGNLEPAHSFFGNSPPPDYQVALIGQVQGRHDALAVVFADGRGRYLTLDGDRAVLASLGPLNKVRFRYCNEAANRQAAAQQQAQRQAEAAARAPVVPGTARSPSELVRDPRFKPAYLRALGPLAREPWLAEMHGPAPELSRQRMGGADYTLAAFCKPHDCDEHNAVVLYDPAQGRVYGMVHQAGRQQSIGSPPGPLLIDLNMIWRRQWRKGR